MLRHKSRRGKQCALTPTLLDGANAVRASWGREGLLCAAVFLLAILVRGFYLSEMGDTPLFGVLMGDAKAYDQWGQRIAGGACLGEEAFYQAPLYPYFLAVTYRLFGHDVGTVRLVQILVGSVSCVLILMAGRRFFSLRIGVIAGFLLAIYPPAIFFDALIQKAVFGLCFMALLVLLLGNLAAAPHWRWSLLSGLALGLLSLTRENALILFPVIAIWLSLYLAGHPSTKRFLCVAAFAFGTAVILTPVGLRNTAVGGEFFLTTSQLGPNFFIGNNIDATGLYRSLRPLRGQAKFERRDAVELAEADQGAPLTSGEVSRYWLGRSLSYIRENPGHWCRLMFRKSLLVFSAAEAGDTESIEAYADSSVVLRTLGRGLHFGVLCPLAAVGFWRTRHRWRRLSVLYCIVLGTALGVALFFVFARYRYPMVAVLLLFAGAGICELVQMARRGRLASLAASMFLLGVTAIVVNTDHLPKGYRPKALTYANLAAGLATQGRTADAIVYHKKALTIQPNLGPAHFGLGVALAEQGDIAQAGRHLKRLVELHPDNAEGHYRLGVVRRRQGDLDEAVQHFTKCLTLQPDHANAHHFLGDAYRRRGDLDQAVEHLKKSVALDPRNVNAHTNLGAVSAALGKYDEALSWYRRAIELEPDHVIAHYNLGSTLARLGKFDQARHHLEVVLRITPDDGEARTLLNRVRQRLAQAD